MTDHDLGAACRALRERHDGHHRDEDATLRRALLATRRGERARRMTRWVVLPIAAVLVASTAWAGATGRLAPGMRGLVDMFRTEDTEPSANANANASTKATTTAPPDSAASTMASAIASPPPIDEPAPSGVDGPLAAAEATAAKPPRPVAITLPKHPARMPAPAAEPAGATRSTSPELAAAPAVSADPANALFAAAHRIHFVEKDPARAVAAWDAYLQASPDGRFVPEAKYNRAIALLRLGRVAEAERDLSVFAGGVYGDYRRDDARALLDALKNDAGK